MLQGRSRRVFQAGFVLTFLLLVLLIYSRSLSAPLLFDSTASLSKNPLVLVTGSQFDSWRRAALSFSGSPLGRPVSMLSFAANYAVEGGFSVTQLRGVNLFLHFLAGVLLYLTLCAVLNKAVTLNFDSAKVRGIAGLAALVWLLHPLNVSTVLYVVQRMTQLSAIFVLLGLWVFASCRGSWCYKSPTLGEFLAVAMWLILITVLAILSKENGVLLLWLLPVIEVSFFKGMWGGKENRTLKLVAWFALLLPLLLVTLLVLSNNMMYLGGYEQRSFSMVERLLTEMRVLWHYVYWLILPNVKVMALHHDDISLSKGFLEPITTALAFAAWAAVLAGAFVARKRYPIVLFCILFYLVAHSLESTVLPLELVWEHRNYLPGMAAALLMSWLGVLLMSRASVVQRWTSGGIVLCLMASLLFVRAERWSDELTLSRAAVINHPQSLRANYHYANTLYRSYDEAQLDARNPDWLPLSRHFYELMYQLDTEDIAALVSLYFLDERYFPALREHVDWFSKLEAAARHRVFSLADFNALGLLSECVDGGGCSIKPQRLLTFYQSLTLRYPNDARVWLLIARYQSNVIGDDHAAVKAINEALARAPSSAVGYHDLLRILDKNHDSGGVMLALSNFLKHDKNRMQLQGVKKMLGLVE